MANNAAAKWKEYQGNGALSVFDGRTDVYIPLLGERAQSLSNARKPLLDLDWIVPRIADYETRRILDNGTGGRKWLDIFVNYVPQAERSESCRGTTMTMRQCLIEFGSIPPDSPTRVVWPQ